MISILEKIAVLKSTYPNNLALHHFEEQYLSEQSDSDRARLLACIKSGLANPDSQMGCYAQSSNDYDRFRPFFSALVAQHHNVNVNQPQRSDWSLRKSDEDGLRERLDFADFNLPAVSMRLRVARNFSDLPLPAAMSKADRGLLEHRMIGVFEQLPSVSSVLTGSYHSLTPDSEFWIDESTHARFVEQHLMFANLNSDRFLQAAGVASDWPYGRGFFLSNDQKFMVWVGEEDHLRVVVLDHGTCLSDLFSGLKNALECLERLSGFQFAFSNHFGSITSCPTNVGTGLRASVHLPLPGLSHCADSSKLAALAKANGLSVRGVRGEHTEAGEDGTVDISPSQRFGVSEVEVVKKLYTGVSCLWSAECAAK